ncbi:DUF192 domain-containing protein [Novosphingobium sp. KCTC 2891]|uniref:DUF192 domain-containing protein n=1 Tax=Novosphingobium sp. KCTC 2891 TaxID=2989730 RepID=UPI0022224300|nr:DUF192 domain-containing protein [Novosphingobium sp. KCTC 2891]MCW1383851.1 DUF192 domain-containing protein [Novosphingobium sp. KCTC 2891]
MKNWIRIAGLAMAAGLVACSPASAGSKAPAPVAAAAPAVHPLSGLAVVPLTVTTAAGPHRFAVEVAATMAEQEKGLMFRTAMGADEGMIFPYMPPQRTAFWMKNTVLPLDIVFVGADHKVLNIAADAVPYDLTPLPSAGPVSGVLELNAGRAKELGIQPGDLVEW